MTKLSYALVFVGDLERSVAFYRDALGWPLTCQISRTDGVGRRGNDPGLALGQQTQGRCRRARRDRWPSSA
jgi:catechol 2,3-dioxygenase-like lactoylglutathione lyase family enzyme